MAKRQTTLFKYNFKKSVEHRGNLLDISEKHYAKTTDAGLFKCISCKVGFKSKTAIIMHQKWCKKVKENDAKGEVLNLPKVGSVDKDVAFALEDLVDKVCQTNTSLTEVRRDGVGRKSYTNTFKFRVIEEASSMAAQSDVEIANKCGKNKSLVAKWKKNRDAIEDAVAQKLKKDLAKIRPSIKDRDVFQKLHTKFVSTRSRGMKVSCAWFHANANRINKELHGSNAARLPKSLLHVS